MKRPPQQPDTEVNLTEAIRQHFTPFDGVDLEQLARNNRAYRI